MPRHLKTRIILRLDAAISYFVPNSEISANPVRGVRYFVPADGIKAFWGAMNTVEEGRRAKKHIIVRKYPHDRNVMQLYTYHFPKTWSAACVANRELIKTAQRLAHALEHDCSYAAIEWRIRFLKHYFRVFRCGEQPEQGLKRYSRFYQYTYVCIYRELKAAQAAQQAQEQAALSIHSATRAEWPCFGVLGSTSGSKPAAVAEDVTFDPIDAPSMSSRPAWIPLRMPSPYASRLINSAVIDKKCTKNEKNNAQICVFKKNVVIL